jgi:uncharacterized membrane protein
LFSNLLIALTNFSWGVWGIFDKKAVEASEPRNVLLVQYFLAFPEVIFLVLYLLTTQHHITADGRVILWAGLGTLTSSVARVAYVVAMSKTEASYVLGITASYPLVVQLLAYLFLGENLVGSRTLGAALIGAGVFAVGYSGKAASTHPPKEQRLILICVIAATIGWGIHGLFDKVAVGYAQPLVVMLVRCVFDVFTFTVMSLIFSKQSVHIRSINPDTWKYSTFSALCLMLGYLSYLQAISMLPASYVIAITGCYPLVMYVFALFFLKEKLNMVRLLGVALVVCGGALVQITKHG